MGRKSRWQSRIRTVNSTRPLTPSAAKSAHPLVSPHDFPALRRTENLGVFRRRGAHQNVKLFLRVVNDFINVFCHESPSWQAAIRRRITPAPEPPDTDTARHGSASPCGASGRSILAWGIERFGRSCVCRHGATSPGFHKSRLNACRAVLVLSCGVSRQTRPDGA